MVRAAKKVDYVVVCLGEQPTTERPSDIKELYLPEAQRDLVKAISKTGKPIILVLLEGRTRIISDIVPLADGILMAYYPGHEGGDAIADVLYGTVNPSGKLPITYQKHAAAPMPYLHTVSDRADNFGTYTDYDPQWPFGFGLSYTDFAYDTLKINDTLFTENDTIKVTVQVSNVGNRKGKEVVQLYLRDEFASLDPDFERLVRFKKVELEAGTSEEVEFYINKNDLAFVSASNEWITEDGTFTLSTGNRSDILKTVSFDYKQTLK